MSLLILVVDDDPTIRYEASSSLEKFGYSVITAGDSQEALNIIEEYHPNLIVTDITMSELDDYQLIRWVRQHPKFRILPVVFLTARVDVEKRIRGYQLGGDACLPKPFELNELYAIVRNLLERSQLMLWEWRLGMQQQSMERQTSSVDTTYQVYLNNQEYIPPVDSIEQIFLTRRERMVLKFLTEGKSNSQIATSLYLSRRTVEKYVSNLLGKTGTNNRVELVHFARKNNLINH
ncbi:response regulator transcription factor [Chlorogloeopsis fritschii PCC 9212]|uniref:DNA-binding response regulator n=1 Tax=Chlorogloeopsis fritschii PCC 6912 TaxID=211165 RepID=A0A3S0ZTW4_CHLFR|nr:response regulator transcription factor [Chlorogloeopsis fritschii]RUR72186.1 DNA-binding response regulator [Chlorogloeopsis fritschii PCC 6912]